MLFSAVVNPSSVPVINMTQWHIRNQLFFDIRLSKVTVLERVYYCYKNLTNQTPALLSHSNGEFRLLGAPDRWIAHAAVKTSLPVIIHSETMLEKDLVNHKKISQHRCITFDKTNIEYLVKEYSGSLEPLDENTVSDLVHGHQEQFRLSLVSGIDRGLARLGSGREIIKINYDSDPLDAVVKVFDLADQAWN
jgi:hypothetical protein